MAANPGETWQCPSCQTDNPGASLFCQFCLRNPPSTHISHHTDTSQDLALAFALYECENEQEREQLQQLQQANSNNNNHSNHNNGNHNGMGNESEEEPQTEIVQKRNRKRKRSLVEEDEIELNVKDRARENNKYNQNKNKAIVGNIYNNRNMHNKNKNKEKKSVITSGNFKNLAIAVSRILEQWKNNDANSTSFNECVGHSMIAFSELLRIYGKGEKYLDGAPKSKNAPYADVEINKIKEIFEKKNDRFNAKLERADIMELQGTALVNQGTGKTFGRSHKGWEGRYGLHKKEEVKKLLALKQKRANNSNNNDKKEKEEQKEMELDESVDKNKNEIANE